MSSHLGFRPSSSNGGDPCKNDVHASTELEQAATSRRVGQQQLEAERENRGAAMAPTGQRETEAGTDYTDNKSRLKSSLLETVEAVDAQNQIPPNAKRHNSNTVTATGNKLATEHAIAHYPPTLNGHLDEHYKETKKLTHGYTTNHHRVMPSNHHYDNTKQSRKNVGYMRQAQPVHHLESSIAMPPPQKMGLTRPSVLATKAYSQQESDMKHKKASLTAYDLLDISLRKNPCSDPGSLDKKNAALVRRNCTSDTNLLRGRKTSSSGSLSNYSSVSRLAVSMVQRSSAQGCKELIETLQANIKSYQDSDNEDQTAQFVPDVECNTLAQLANDAYYRVVISASGGIPIIIKSMQTFPGHLRVQVAGCTALGNLCTKNGSNQVGVHSDGGITAIITAMKIHSSSIVVQSAACDALFHMKGFMSSLLIESDEELTIAVIEALTKAKTMYMMPNSAERAENVLDALVRDTKQQAADKSGEQ